MDKYLKNLKSQFKSFSKKYLKRENLIEIGKYVALMGICITFLIIVVKYLYRQGAYFITNHPVAVCIIAILGLVIYEKMSKKKPESNMPEQMSKSATQQTHIHLGSTLYHTLIDIKDVSGICIPRSIEKLNPPKKASVADGVVYFHFIALVKDKDIEVNNVHSLLEYNINNLIRNKKIVGFNIDGDTVINGYTYPPVMVHDVSVINHYVSITLVLTTEKYIRQLNQLKRVEMANNIKADIFDDDEDF